MTVGYEPTFSSGVDMLNLSESPLNGWNHRSINNSIEVGHCNSCAHNDPCNNAKLRCAH